MRRKVAGVCVLAATLAAGLRTAVALAGGSGTAARAATGQLNIKFGIQNFTRSGKAIVANGAVVATYSDAGGSHQTSQPFHARVLLNQKAKDTTCKVLFLQLDKLSLTLLGLNANLDKVVLTINGNSAGGALGSLFCQLAKAKVSLGGLTKSAARMTQAVKASSLGSAVGFGIPLVAGAAAAGQAGTCPVLDLVLGPLHLELLGLIVDLNQVHLSITA